MRDLIDPKIAEHSGRLVKTTGDGLLMEFASAVNAVRCASEIQAAMAARNVEVPADRRIEFRVGVNIGDIIIDGDDIFGDGVNVAARLQEMAEPGTVYASGSAHQQVRDKLEMTFTDLGERQAKNIARAVRVWRVPNMTSPGAPASISFAAVSNTKRERAARPRLAVLPFDNLGGDAEIEGFCDGLSEDLIAALSGFRWLSVVSRKSSFAYKGRSPDIRHVAHELGVTYVVEGSVRRTGNRMRINAQLLEAQGGTHTWGRRYDRELGDPFAVQDEVVRHIAGSLDYVLWYEMVRAAGTAARQANPVLAAAWHMTQVTAADTRLAIACVRRALERNPRSVAAYQNGAFAHLVNVVSGWTGDFAADTASGLEAARRAVALNPAVPTSQALFGWALAMTRDGDNALLMGRNAFATDSNSFGTLASVAALLSLAGDAREAIDVIARTLDLAPAHYTRPRLTANMALNCLRLGVPDRGLPFAEEAVKLTPEMPFVHVARAAVLGAVGRTEDARAALAKALALRPDMDWTFVDAMSPYSAPADTERLHDALSAAGLRDSEM
jgi:adenylate cyclase